MKILLALLLSTGFASAQLLSKTGLTNGYVLTLQSGVLANSPLFVTGNSIQLNGLPLGLQPGAYAVPHSSTCYFTNVYVTNIVATDTDVFQVPSGYRFLPLRFGVLPQTNSTVVYGSVRTNGNTFRLTTGSTLGVASGILAIPGFFVFDQGETVVLSSSGPLDRVSLHGLVFTNSIPLKTYRQYDLALGDNTVYTAGATVYANAYGSSSQLNLTYFNGTVGTTAVAWYQIPFGGTTNTGTLVAAPSVTTLQSSGLGSVPLIQPRETIKINTDSGASGQTAWLTVIESN